MVVPVVTSVNVDKPPKWLIKLVIKQVSIKKNKKETISINNQDTKLESSTKLMIQEHLEESEYAFLLDNISVLWFVFNNHLSSYSRS